MKFKEFDEWCNERARDGLWGAIVAIQCSSIYNEIYSKPVREREKEFQKYVNETNLVEIINRINERYGIEKQYTIEIVEEDYENVPIFQKIKDWFTGHERK